MAGNFSRTSTFPLLPAASTAADSPAAPDPITTTSASRSHLLVADLETVFDSPVPTSSAAPVRAPPATAAPFMKLLRVIVFCPFLSFMVSSFPFQRLFGFNLSQTSSLPGNKPEFHIP